MWPRCAEFRRRFRRGRGLAALALLVVVPKCLVCLAAYAGFGVVLGLGGPEMCGGVDEPPHAAVAVSLVAGAVLLLADGGLVPRKSRRKDRVSALVAPVPP